MTYTLENFYNSETSPAPTETLAPANTDSYYLLVDDLEKAMREGNQEKITNLDAEITNLLKQKLQVIVDKQKELEEKESKDENRVENIINLKNINKYEKDAKSIIEQRLSLNRNYQNIISTELKDKKIITALYVVNAFMLVILLMGVILLFNNKSFTLDIVKKTFKGRVNNKRNNNLNNNNSNSIGL